MQNCQLRTTNLSNYKFGEFVSFFLTHRVRKGKTYFGGWLGQLRLGKVSNKCHIGKKWGLVGVDEGEICPSGQG